MNRALVALGVVIVLLVAALAIVPAFVDWNDYKPEFAARVEAATGRKLTIEGDLSLSVLPAPVLAARSVRLANVEGAVAPDMASAESIEVALQLGPLLRGRIAFSTITLVDPVIELEVLADGRRNWVLAAPDGAGGGAGGADEDAGRASAAPAIAIASLAVENGTLIYRDTASGRLVAIEELNARLRADSFAGPLETEGALQVSGVPVAFEVAVGEVGASGGVPLRARVTLGEDTAELTFQGSASELGAAARVRGKLAVAGDDLGRAWTQLGDAIGGASAPPAMAQPFAVTTAIDASVQELALNELTLTLGDAVASGALSAAFGETLRVDAALAVNRFDLDRWIGGADAPRAPAPASATRSSGARAADPGFALPTNVAGSFSLVVEALVYNDQVARQFAVEATMAEGVVTVRRISALLPGGSDISLAGSVAARDGVPEFTARLEAASDNLRAVLGWLKIDTDAVPADRLRKFVLTSTLRLTPDLIQIYGVDLRLDSSRLTGGLAYALRARPSFSIDIELDRLNADAYLPPARATPAADSDAAATPSKPAEARLAALGGVDADVKVRVRNLTYSQTQISDLVLDFTLIRGRLTIRDARAGDLGGAKVALSGRASGFDGVPDFTIKFDVQASESVELLRLARRAAPLPHVALGAVAAAGTVARASDVYQLDVALQAAASQLEVKGSLATAGSVDIVFDAQSKDVAALAQLFAAAPLPGLSGPLSLKGRVNGDVRRLTVDVAGSAAGAELSVTGTLDPGAGPAYALAVATRFDSVEGALRLAGIDYRPATANLGGLALEADVVGEAGAVKLSGLSGSIGPVNLEGSASLRYDGPRPRLDADLSTSDIFVDLFLPLPTKATASAGAPRARRAGASSSRWSSEPIDFSFLGALDAEVALRSRALIYGAYEVGEPRLALTLLDGVLNVNPLAGTMLGGDLALGARLENASPPRAAVTLALRDARLESVAPTAMGFGGVRGRVDVDGEFTSAGASERELIAGLNGSAVITARDGAIKGIDLRRLSDRLKRLDQALDFLALLQDSLSGGETRFSTIEGEFLVVDGIVRATDFQARLDAAAGDLKGTVDLPRWEIDMRAGFRLTEHPKVPAVGLQLSGSLDAPRREIESREIKAYLAQRVTGAILDKALGSDDGSGGGAAGKLLRGLLGGALGKGQ